MKFDFRRNLYFYGLLISLLPFLFIYVGNSYDWEGDTALLLRQAENISTGKPFHESDFIYNSEFTITSPAYYPPMAPLLFSGIHFFYGHNIHMYLLQESILYIFLGILIYFFFRRSFKEWIALIATVLLLYNQYIFRVKLEIMTDTLFSILVLIFFLLTEKKGPKKMNHLIFAGIIGAIAIETRSIGYTLPMAVIIYISFDWIKDRFSVKSLIRKRLYEVVVLGAMTVTLIIFRAVFHPPSDGISIYTTQFSYLTFEIILQNIWLYLNLIIAIIISPFNGWGIVASLIHILIFLITVTGLFRISYRQAGLSIIFVIIYLGVLIIYPYQLGGARLLLPVLPFILVVFIKGFDYLIQLIPWKNAKVLIIVFFLTAETVITIKGHYYYHQNRKPSALTTQETLEAFNKIKKLTDNQSVFETSFPRIIAFYTGRKAYSSGPDASLSQYIINKKKFNGDYLLHSKKFGYNSEQLLIESHNVQLIWQNREYQLFKFIEP